MLIGSVLTTLGQVPKITSFSPTSGKPGTLTGTNFNTTPTNNIVLFGATRATVTAASALSVTVTVPTGATYTPITLLNTGTSLATYSLRNFTPTYSPAITATNFQAKQDFTAGTNPESVAIGDLDGDGKPDLIVANYGSNTLSVYRNTSLSGSIGTSSYAAKVDFTNGTNPTSVAIGDVDGDGKPDLAVVNYNSNTVSVLRNTSTSGSVDVGSFAHKVDFATGTNPASVAIGDVDGDGKLELSIVNASSNTVSVLRNTSSFGSIDAGSFVAKVDFITGTTPLSIALGDLDGDGKLDLAVANYGSNTVSVIRNTSSSGIIDIGSFAVKVDFATGSFPYSVAVGDLDGDSKPDLVLANTGLNTVSVIRNTSTSGSIVAGSFSAKVDFTTGTTPYSVAMGDLDGNGKPDLVVANFNSASVSVFRNTSTIGSITSGSFATRVNFTTGTNPRSVAIGDLDGDGKPELALSNRGSNSVSVLRNASNNADLASLTLSSGTSSPIFATATTAYTASVANTTTTVTVTPTTADANATITVNGVTTTSGTASGLIALSVGNNTITTQVTPQDGITKTYTVTVTRAASDNANLVGLALSPGTLTLTFSLLTTAYIASVGGGTTSLTVSPRADVNATITVNGITTTSGTASGPIALSVGSNTITTQVNAQDGTTIKTYTVTVTRAEAPPVITNFSPLNGKPGEVVTLTGTGFNNIATNNVVFFGATRATVTAATVTSVTVNVPTGATYAPITLLNTATRLAGYSLRNFTPTYSPAKTAITATDFQAKQDFTPGINPQSVAVGDLDEDGKSDLVVVNQGSSTVSVYRNTSISGNIGAGSFATKVDFTTGTQPYSVAIGDVDGDGKPDLVLVNVISSSVSVFRNTSTSGSIDIGSFAARVDFTTGAITYSVAIGDLDGDGKPELVVANGNSSSVSVFRNTSTSGSITVNSFATKVDFSTPTGPRSVAIGDLDGDGKLDLAVANFNSNSVSIFRNTSVSGSITGNSFAPNIDFSTGQAPISVVIGDLDGDGRPDLVVANARSYGVSVFRNTSSSGSITVNSFTVKVDFLTGVEIDCVALGDLDGNGKSDIVVVNTSLNFVSVFRNTSTNGSITTGSFAPRVDFITGTIPISIAIGDLDGDGKPDLAVANEQLGNVSVLRNTSNEDLFSLTLSSGTLTPTFAPATTSYTASVQNGTTSLTVTPRANASSTITVNGLTTVNGNVSNTIALSVGSNTITTQVTAQDGTTTKTYTVTVTRAEAPPVITNFSPLNGKPGEVVTLTGTGFNNIATNNVVFFGATRATVTAATVTSVTVNVPTGATYAPITLLNTATRLAGYSLRNFTPTYSPAKTAITATDFQAKQDFTPGINPQSVAVGDLDEDGKSDLVVVNQGSSTVSVYRNTSSSGSIGANSFAAKVDFTTGTNPLSVTIGDLDGDGKPELVVANQGSNTVSVIRNTATFGSIVSSSFSAKVDFVTGSFPYSVTIGDLDGDGKPELAVANYISTTVSVIRNTSTSGSIVPSSFAPKVDFATGTNPYSVAISDLDGDGKAELTVANRGSNTVSVLRNTSNVGSIISSSFAAKVDFTTGSYPQSVTIGDLDGDGKPELAVANYGSSTVSVFQNTTTSGSIDINSFTFKVDFTTGSSPNSLTIGDLDGDGKPDLVVVNRFSNTVSVIRNTSTSGNIGTGSFVSKVDFITGIQPVSVAFGDLDGDGKPELAVANSGSSTVSLLRSRDIIAISISNGAWNNPSTWNINRIPLPSESVIIDQNHTVEITTVVGAKTIEYKSNAKLSFTNASSKLNIGL